MAIISNEKPDIYKRLNQAFGVEWDKGLIIAHNGVIHTSASSLPGYKIAHEETHLAQQAGANLEEWWEKYIADKEFRLRMETEAYQAESKWIEKNIRDRNVKYTLRHRIAVDLSSTIYGCIITYSDALKLIK